MIVNLSLPTRGAWIETQCLICHLCPDVKSLPTRGAWIETWYLSDI